MKNKDTRPPKWDPNRENRTPKGTKAAHVNDATVNHKEMLEKQDRLRRLNPLNL